MTGGLYEQLVTEAIQDLLTSMGPALHASMANLDPGDSHDLLRSPPPRSLTTPGRP